jgi:hypothetical protein
MLPRLSKTIQRQLEDEPCAVSHLRETRSRPAIYAGTTTRQTKKAGISPYEETRRFFCEYLNYRNIETAIQMREREREKAKTMPSAVISGIISKEICFLPIFLVYYAFFGMSSIFLSFI